VEQAFLHSHIIAGQIETSAPEDGFLMKLSGVSQKVLLTGRPSSGKTTLIKRVLSELPQLHGGFYTEEIREHGARVGFKVVALHGDEAVFAHVDFTTPERIGKYRLDLTALEAVGVKAIRQAVQARRLIVIDEIGPMEIRSAIFRDAVSAALDSGMPVLGTIVARSLPFADAIKLRPDVTVVEVRPDNREKLVSELANKLRNPSPAGI
jgi:nucleoside-triphosphatase